jgi:tryptophan synthase beta chain
MEALEAFHELSRLEGIIPALESAHAIAYVRKMADHGILGDTVVINLSGRGDKDLQTIMDMEE